MDGNKVRKMIYSLWGHRGKSKVHLTREGIEQTGRIIRTLCGKDVDEYRLRHFSAETLTAFKPCKACAVRAQALGLEVVEKPFYQQTNPTHILR